MQYFGSIKLTECCPGDTILGGIQTHTIVGFSQCPSACSYGWQEGRDEAVDVLVHQLHQALIGQDRLFYTQREHVLNVAADSRTSNWHLLGHGWHKDL